MKIILNVRLFGLALAGMVNCLFLLPAQAQFNVNVWFVDEVTKLPVRGATVTILEGQVCEGEDCTWEPCVEECTLIEGSCGNFVGAVIPSPQRIRLSIEHEHYVTQYLDEARSDLFNDAYTMERDTVGSASYFAGLQHFWVEDPSNPGDIEHALMIVNSEGDVRIAGSWQYESSTITDESAQELIIKKSNGTIIAKLDDSGNYVSKTDGFGGLLDPENLNDPAEQEFRIVNPVGDTVFRIRHGNGAGHAGAIECSGCLSDANLLATSIVFPDDV